MLKVLLVVLLLYFLSRKGMLSMADTGKAFTRPERIIPGMVAVFLTHLLSMVRWQFLLRAQSFDLRWSRTFQLTFVGNFFNIALPGSVSGDVVKAYYVSKETRAGP